MRQALEDIRALCSIPDRGNADGRLSVRKPVWTSFLAYTRAI